MNQLLRRRILLIPILIFLLLLIMYYIGNGFSLNDNIVGTAEDFKVRLNKPDTGDTFYTGDDIVVSGSVWGGIPKKVIVWDEKYNIPIECHISGSYFNIRLYADDLSTGFHTLCVQAQADNGRWSRIETVSIEKKEGGRSGKTWVESFFPPPIAYVFRPVEDIIRNIAVVVSGGTSPNDLNGDNIPDEVQQSPVPPRYNPMNLPLSVIIVFGLIILLILVVVLKILHPILMWREKTKMEIHRSPTLRRWYLKMKALKNKELRARLKTEKTRRRRLEQRLKKMEKQAASRPVKIFIGKNER